MEPSAPTDFRKIEKYRSMILSLFLEVSHLVKLKSGWFAVYGDSYIIMATVKNWFNEFQCDYGRFLMMHVHVYREQLLRRTKWQKSTIND